MYIAEWRVLPAKHHKLHRNANKGEKQQKKQRESMSDPNNADPPQVMKVNPNPECKHQIIQLHALYRINTFSFIALSLY